MFANDFRLDFDACWRLLNERLHEPAPARIQLLSGPRQVGKTTLMLDLARKLGDSALYFAVDSPETGSVATWSELWTRAETMALTNSPAVLLIDEIQVLPGWGARLKSEWDRIQRTNVPIHVVATGSSALKLGSESRETLAGRFERVILTHWSASSLASAFNITPEVAADTVLRVGSYPGAFGYRKQARRWSSYMQDSILAPALGQDITALASVPDPNLFRRLFAVCAGAPSETFTLEQLHARIELDVSYASLEEALEVLEEAYLVAALHAFERPESAARETSPRKLIALNNGLIAAVDRRGAPERTKEPARFRDWVENACLAHAWNSGQRVSYADEKTYQIDGILQGGWGNYALEVATGGVQPNQIRHLEAFRKKHPGFVALLITCADTDVSLADNANILTTTWSEFLVNGPPHRRKVSYEPGGSNRA